MNLRNIFLEDYLVYFCVSRLLSAQLKTNKSIESKFGILNLYMYEIVMLVETSYEDKSNDQCSDAHKDILI